MASTIILTPRKSCTDPVPLREELKQLVKEEIETVKKGVEEIERRAEEEELESGLGIATRNPGRLLMKGETRRRCEKGGLLSLCVKHLHPTGVSTENARAEVS